MALNENHWPMLPGVHEALVESLGSVNRTGDALAARLEGRLAAELGSTADRVVAGAGSGALLQQFLSAHCGPGSEVLHTWPSFDLYPLLIRNAGAEPVAVPGDSRGGQDLDALAAAVTDRTRVVLVCNPNNPTGEVLGTGELTALLAALPAHVLLLVDEAYREFADPAAIADAVGLSTKDRRVAVVRTFSKSHGLIGLRVGYLTGAEELVAPLRRTSPFHRVPTVAQAAALAALDADARMREQCREVAAERDRVRRGLTELGFDVPPSGGNYLWVRLGPRNQEFIAHLASYGVAVREVAGGVRVSTGLPHANDVVLAAARAFATLAAPHAEGALR
ncbi:aminotransferase class I/II-fold pyridoxal phosphate-dependent enzyme [Crossiella sp. CA-258035]|uniref:aminotransferase class I/II-fold pyridoxal phosphate-dependent enzyme n=1 Tax=Crossiella sp. CA-258035 TaxID=2981138 RepID=UPI0024BC5C39|nr:aminotransferase class I/II-fold pyridoxal phosphate-dependent enzyme [Crossiella sp. CA-258035]WHT16172.1 aminotransferase class I/II-fold pyridoxal phosphate-dependent enzyme [Crossiella sp. CA-258035]